LRCFAATPAETFEEEPTTTTISDISLTPDPKPALLDYSNTEAGSSQFDFESANNSISFVDLRFYGVFSTTYSIPLLKAT